MQYLNKFIITIGDIYQSIELSLIEIDTERSSLIHNLIGTILKSCPLSQFLTLIPFTLPTTPIYQGIDKSREWLINILSIHLKSIPCRLMDFINLIMITKIAKMSIVREKIWKDYF